MEVLRAHGFASSLESSEHREALLREPQSGSGERFAVVHRYSLIMKMIMNLKYAAAALLVLCSLNACAADRASSEGVSVVAAFYPLEEMARQIGGDRVTVTNLTPAGAEPHDL